MGNPEQQDLVLDNDALREGLSDLRNRLAVFPTVATASVVSSPVATSRSNLLITPLAQVT